MNDKEYTYEIDKYTIGVDENGENGIGLTVAIIKNGGIKFLGNCYGENARCIDLLIKENQELKKKYSNAVSDYETAMAEKNKLKKQRENCYCNRTDCSGRIKDSKQYDSLEQKVEKQQQEFVKYLEDEIERKRLNATCMFEYNDTVLPLKEILQKYKEIIGVSDENNIK